jgi:hypothetical protein
MRPAAPEIERTAARLMRYMFGAPYPRIAALLGRATPAVARWCDARYAAAQAQASKVYLGKCKGQGRAPITQNTRMRRKLRLNARAEAAQSGENLQAVYQRWGCA